MDQILFRICCDNGSDQRRTGGPHEVVQWALPWKLQELRLCFVMSTQLLQTDYNTTLLPFGPHLSAEVLRH